MNAMGGDWQSVPWQETPVKWNIVSPHTELVFAAVDWSCKEQYAVFYFAFYQLNLSGIYYIALLVI